MKTSGFRVPCLYRVLAEKEIRVPRAIAITRWVSFIYRLSEKDLDVENEIFIQIGRKEDLEFFVSSEDMNDRANHILLQDIKFWDEYGFRCLQVGYLKGEHQPFCLVYVIDDSDNHRFDIMEYGDMYQKLESDTAHVEGGYVRKDLRGQGLFPKFRAKINKMLYKKGKKIVRSHIASSTGRIASLKAASKAGLVPNYWISRVNISLPFFRSSAFVPHDIKRSDFSKFPLSLFHLRR